jgi:hypothetical protein
MTREEKVLQLKQDFDEVYDAGKQAEYDAFWDVFQNNGNRTDYARAFADGKMRYLNPNMIFVLPPQKRCLSVQILTILSEH